jgi:hypothetical protein
MLVSKGVFSTCLQKQIEFPIRQKDLRSQERGRKARCTPAVFTVITIIQTAGIMQEGEEFHYLGMGACAGGELQAI